MGIAAVFSAVAMTAGPWGPLFRMDALSRGARKHGRVNSGIFCRLFAG
jgi:hypothetical protein